MAYLSDEDIARAVRGTAGQLALLLDEMTDGARVALMADLHDMSADLPEGARRLLSLALEREEVGD